MDGLFLLLLFAVFVYVMMRFGCGTHMVHGGNGQHTAAAGDNTYPVCDPQAAIMQGAMERVRPKKITAVAIMAGLLPILWSSNTGSEVMRHIVAPMVGSMILNAEHYESHGAITRRRETFRNYI